MKHIQLFESYTNSEDVAEELDNWIEANSDYISASSLEDKINELIGEGKVEIEVETIEDKGGMEYGEDWSTQVITVKFNGKVLMKVCPNQDAQGGQKSQQTQDATMDVQKMVDRLMIHLKMGDRLMDDQNYSVCLNYRDALPCTHSLITIQI